MKLFLLSSLAMILVAVLMSVIGAHPVSREEPEGEHPPNENLSDESSDLAKGHLRPDSVSPEHSL